MFTFSHINDNSGMKVFEIDGGPRRTICSAILISHICIIEGTVENILAALDRSDDEEAAQAGLMLTLVMRMTGKRSAGWIVAICDPTGNHQHNIDTVGDVSEEEALRRAGVLLFGDGENNDDDHDDMGIGDLLSGLDSDMFAGLGD